MKTETRTAIIMVLIIATAVVGAWIYFSSFDSQIQNVSNPNNDGIDTNLANETTKTPIIDKSKLKKAPELVGIGGYINTTPDQLKVIMKGKVVLYDIWTYSCINCIRTLPYIVAWNDKYADKGLLIIGIHSPEFEFEKDINNVKTAVKQFGISYPVVLDNDKKTWDAFENNYWPRKYIADSEGYIRYDHIGEGGYDETEKIIQKLLAERNQLLGLDSKSSQPLVDLKEEQFNAEQTPEIYFGYNFAFGRNHLGNSEGFKPDRVVTYSLPEKLFQDFFYLEGQWHNFSDRMELVSENGKIVLPYYAKSVNIVAANESDIQILLDGKPVSQEDSGTDLQNGIIHVSGDRLYNLISSKAAGAHTLTITAERGFQMYTFTFG